MAQLIPSHKLSPSKTLKSERMKITDRKILSDVGFVSTLLCASLFLNWIQFRAHTQKNYIELIYICFACFCGRMCVSVHQWFCLLVCHFCNIKMLTELNGSVESVSLSAKWQRSYRMLKIRDNRIEWELEIAHFAIFAQPFNAFRWLCFFHSFSLASTLFVSDSCSIFIFFCCLTFQAFFFRCGGGISPYG